MRLGVGPIPLEGATRTSLERLAMAASAASFDSVWVAEARSRGVGGGLAAAALVAQLVPIRVGALVDVGGYHPLHLAEDLAVADLASQGRLEVLLRGGAEDQLRLLVAALSGAHLDYEGGGLRVPAHIDANQPVPERLALNPRPAQPVVPIWVLERRDEVASELGLGVATEWRAGVSAPSPAGRWPGMLLCPGNVDAENLLLAAGDGAPYFLIRAESPDGVAIAGRRLVGPLRMPGFPGWISAQ